MSAIACGARSKRESRSASGSVQNWVSFAGLTARSRASSMHCVASGRRWPRPSAASWTCWGSSSDRWPTSRTASRRSSPSLSVRRGGTSRSRRLATDDARRQVEPEGSSPSPNRADGVSWVHKLAGRASVPYDAGMERTTSRRPRRGGGAKASPAGVAPTRTELTVAPAVEIELLVPGEPPEPSFAARVPPPAPERRRPTTRHAIFFDVENTSHPAHIERVIERLAIDHLGRSTEFVAVRNWRVIAPETARLLARHGAQLVHSAPSTGVRDWSDLRIAVSAGVWLGSGRPGDLIEIISDDRAFDAVGDVAAVLGVEYRRLSYRGLTGLAAASEEAPTTEAQAPREGRGRRGGRGRRRSGRGGRSRFDQGARGPTPPRGGSPSQPPPARAPEPARVQPDADAHTAPHDELVEVVRELADHAPNGAVLIDTLARALKERGFSRPPGSPRLITRLRRIRQLQVSQTGRITLADGGRAAATPADESPLADAEVEAAEVDLVAAAEEATPGNEVSPAPDAPQRSRRRRRRGGRGRGRGRGGSVGGAPNRAYL